MKYAVFTLAAALFAAAAPVQAQQQDRPQPRAERDGKPRDAKQRLERRVQMLDEKLDLNDSQVARIRTILTQEVEQMQARFQANAATRQRVEGTQRPRMTPAQRDSARAQLKLVRDRTDAAILEVLNAEQKTQYQKFQQERGRKGGRDGHEGRKRGDRRDA